MSVVSAPPSSVLNSTPAPTSTAAQTPIVVQGLRAQALASDSVQCLKPIFATSSGYLWSDESTIMEAAGRYEQPGGGSDTGLVASIGEIQDSRTPNGEEGGRVRSGLRLVRAMLYEWA